MPGSAIIHRKSLLAVGGFDESLWACEDYDVYLKLCRNYKTAFHENIVAYYRITTTGLSMNGVRMLQKGNLVLDRQRPYISSNPQLVNACRAGRENFKNTYGRKIVFNAVQYIAKGELTSAASCISVLFTHSPKLAIKLIARGLRVFPRYMYSKLRNN